LKTYFNPARLVYGMVSLLLVLATVHPSQEPLSFVPEDRLCREALDYSRRDGDLWLTIHFRRNLLWTWRREGEHWRISRKVLGQDVVVDALIGTGEKFEKGKDAFADSVRAESLAYVADMKDEYLADPNGNCYFPGGNHPRSPERLFGFVLAPKVAESEWIIHAVGPGLVLGRMADPMALKYKAIGFGDLYKLTYFGQYSLPVMRDGPFGYGSMFRSSGSCTLNAKSRRLTQAKMSVDWEMELPGQSKLRSEMIVDRTLDFDKSWEDLPPNT